MRGSLGGCKLRNVGASRMPYCCNYGSECLLCWVKALPQGGLLTPLLPCYFSAQVCKFEAVREQWPLCWQRAGQPTLRQCPGGTVWLWEGMASLYMTQVVRRLDRASAQRLGLLKEGIPMRGRRQWAEAWV